MKQLSLLAALTLLMLGCQTSNRYTMSGPADLAPAAQAKLNVEEGKYGNRELNLNVKHLAPADRVEPGAESYVVWVQPEGSASAQNLGTLGLSRNLSANFKTQVAYDNFDFFVTAEQSSVVREPTGPRIFEESITE